MGRVPSEGSFSVSTVIGIDQSLTSTGLAMLSTDGSFARTKAVVPKTHGIPRLREIEAAVVRWVEDAPEYPDLVVMEGYSFGARGRSIFQLGELGGVLKVALARLGFEESTRMPARGLNARDEEGQGVDGGLVVVPPTQLKKFATSKGTADKRQMALSVYKRWGFEADTDDEVDAYALARLGAALLGVADGLTEVQRGVVDKLLGNGEPESKKTRRKAGLFI